jgi:hypothetical protein
VSAVAIAFVLGNCGGNPVQPQQADCSLPWSTVEQVFDCGSPNYEVASKEGGQTVNIIVPSKDSAAIAAALAHAWNEEIPFYEEAVVWAWSDQGQIGSGYDRGVLSEQGELGNLLVFEICTDWTDNADELGEICSDRMRFTIDQDADA